MITVIDPGTAWDLLKTGRVAYPQTDCPGRLRSWGRSRSRTVRALDAGVAVVRPDPGRCRTCGVTQVLLPAQCLPRRGYHVQVITTAMAAYASGASHPQAAAACRAPLTTVRDWIRCATLAAPHPFNATPSPS